jgi:hypothetical protein
MKYYHLWHPQHGWAVCGSHRCTFYSEPHPTGILREEVAKRRISSWAYSIKINGEWEYGAMPGTELQLRELQVTPV